MKSTERQHLVRPMSPCASANRHHVSHDCMQAVLRYCRSRTLSDADAEDAAQAAFVRFLRHGGDDVRHPEAWLVRAADFECRELRRRRAREGMEAPPHSDEQAPFHLESTIADRLWVEELFRRLSPADRELLTLRFVADMSAEQIADRTGQNAGAVRAMTLRARRRALNLLHAMGQATAGLLAGAGLHRRAAMRRLVRLRRARPSLDSLWRSTAERTSSWSWWLAVEQVAAPSMAVAFVLAAAAPVSAMPAPGVVPVAMRSESAGVVLPTPPPSLVPAVHTSPRTPHPTTSTAIAGSSTPESTAFGLLPGGGNRQEDSEFSSVSPSPSYAHDRTAFASGVSLRSCPGGRCPVLFHTVDGGTTWQRLLAAGFTGGRILLPPSYPRDTTLYALSPSGALQQSTDGGLTFQILLVGVTAAAISPDSVPGDTRVLVALTAVRLLLYDTATGEYTPGPMLPASTMSVDDITYLGRSDRLVVTGTAARTLQPTQRDGVLVTCDTLLCTTRRTYAGESGIRLAASPTSAVDGTVIVLHHDRLEISHDGAVSVQPLLIGAGLPAEVSPAADYATSHLMIIRTQVDGNTSRLARSVDDGATFTTTTLVPQDSLPQALSALQVLPDHRILVGLAAPDSDGFGLRCSTDGGRHWSAACPDAGA